MEDAMTAEDSEDERMLDWGSRYEVNVLVTEAEGGEGAPIIEERPPDAGQSYGPH